MTPTPAPKPRRKRTRKRPAITGLKPRLMGDLRAAIAGIGHFEYRQVASEMEWRLPGESGFSSIINCKHKPPPDFVPRCMEAIRRLTIRKANELLKKGDREEAERVMEWAPEQELIDQAWAELESQPAWRRMTTKPHPGPDPLAALREVEKRKESAD